MRQRLFWASIMLVLFLSAMSSCSEATSTPSPTTPPPTPSPTPTETTSPPKVDHQPEIKLAAIRTIFLAREDYLLEIEAQFRPESPGECSGRFDQDKHTPADYRHYQADGVALWRAKVEEGQSGGYNDDILTFITIISPTELADPTDSEGVVGRYTCALEIEGKIFAIDYRLPHSLSEIETGQHRADILAEMDEILQSIIWDVDGGSPQPTPTPLGYDATPTTTTVPLPQPTGTPTSDEISQVKAARTI